MRHWIRDFFRRRRIRSHIAKYGSRYLYHGVEVTVPIEAGLGVCSALLRGKYESGEAAMIQRYLPPERPVIELGGSLGVVSALVGSRLNTKTQHLIVEANPEIIPICVSNASSGKRIAATRIINAALAYDCKKILFPIGNEVHANALGRANDAEKIVEVETTTLGDLHKQIRGKEGYTLICDIEGAEFDLCQRESAVLAQAGLIIVELHPKVYPRGTTDEELIVTSLNNVGLDIIDKQEDVWVFRRP